MLVRVSRFAIFLVVVLSAQSSLAADLAGQRPYVDFGRITLIEENDALAPAATDGDYTQGARLSYLSAPLYAGAWWDNLFVPRDALWGNGQERVRRYEVIAGQSLFTPRNTRLDPPDPRDRPFAGWLYGGVALLQETDRRTLDSLELLVGVVGPSALGRQTQAAFHSALGQSAPTWTNQLADEPGVVLSYERRWRFSQPLASGLTFEVIPEVGASVGNVFTYGEVGAMIRVGQNLGVDYGPARIRPALSGTSWFDASRLVSEFGWYVFASTQARLVGRNIFLDGNTFRDGPSVDKEPVVADFSAGLSLFWANRLKVDFVLTQRTKEFKGQDKAQHFGGITVSFALP